MFGFFPSTFLITANFGNEQHVLEGVPVDGSVIAGGMTHYSFDMSQINGGTVDIDVAATNGLPAIYVSMKNVPTAVQGGYDYKAASSFSGTHLTIDSAAACGLPGAEKPCIMHIGVFGDWSAGYTLLVTLGGGGRNINLINGRSISANLADDKYAYYTMVVPDKEMDLIITVQPFSGDSDLYVSNEPWQTQPNATNYKWRARAAGVDSVALHDVEPGNYYIGPHTTQQTHFFAALPFRGPGSLLSFFFFFLRVFACFCFSRFFFFHVLPGVHGFSACRYSITGFVDNELTSLAAASVTWAAMYARSRRTAALRLI